MSKPTVALVFGTTHINIARLPTVGPVCKVATPGFITDEASAPCRLPPYHTGVIEARLLDALAPVLRDIFTRVLLVKPQECKVILSIPCLWPASLTGCISTCLLQVLQVQCLYHLQLSHAAVAAGGRHSGIAIDVDRGILTPVLATEACPSKSVLTGLCCDHVCTSAALVLLSAARALSLAQAHSQGQTVQAAGHSAQGMTTKLSGNVIPQLAGAALGYSFPLDVYSQGQPSSPSLTQTGWASRLAKADAGLPMADAGHAGVVSRWVRDVLEGKEAHVHADSIHVRVPAPLAAILGLALTTSTAPVQQVQGKAAKTGSRASLPHATLIIPIVAWESLSNLLLHPYDSLQSILQECAQGMHEGEGRGQPKWSDEVQALYDCCKQAVHELMYGNRELLSLQEGVTRILQQSPLPDRKALAQGVVPYGDMMHWCQAGLGQRLAHAVAHKVQQGAKDGDRSMAPLVALLPSIRVYHPVAPTLACSAHITGTAALGMALIGTIVITGGTTMVPKRKGGGPKSKGVEYKGGSACVPVPIAPPTGSIHRSDALVEHGLTPAHAALYEQMGVPLPLQDWAQTAAPILRTTSSQDTGMPPVAAPAPARAPSDAPHSKPDPVRAQAQATSTSQAAKTAEQPASNAARLEALSSRMRAARKK